MDFKKNTATVVTAFYNLKKKKYTSYKYFNWMKNFLSIDCYMLIYADDETCAEKIRELRKEFEDKTVVVVLPFDELHCSQYIDYWKKDYARDHEKYHDPGLYIIWNEKTAFMKRGKDLNPFNTEYFCWADIGMVREEGNLQYINTFPSSKMLSLFDKTRVYLLYLYPFTEEEKNTVNDATEIFRYTNHVGGGLIMCHKDLVDTWYDTYYGMLNRFFEKDLFAGKDQSILNCLSLVRQDLIKLILPHHSPFDQWFYMLFYFSDMYYDKYKDLQ